MRLKCQSRTQRPLRGMSPIFLSSLPGVFGLSMCPSAVEKEAADTVSTMGQERDKKEAKGHKNK
jgi:hypothetical protein